MAPLKYALVTLMFFVTLALASTLDDDGVYFEYERAPDDVNESWDGARQRTAETGQPANKRAVAILNRLVMVAQRANNKSHQQRMANAENARHAQLYKLPPPPPIALNSPAARELEVLADSLENSSDPMSDQKTMALPRLNFERRDQKAPRVFWRCYFNAVSCFR